MARYIFVTGGVVSSLGKGIAAASLAAVLEARGLKVTLLKLDPYINVDPGTMSPFQHGEVFVTEDGAETDLDLGHYERFTDTALSRLNSVTTGSSGRRWVVDPIDGTRLCALGMPGALAVIAMADSGSMYAPGSLVYMDKIAVGEDAAITRYPIARFCFRSSS